MLLDVGCGTGSLLAELKLFGKTRGIDPSREAIAICHNRGLRQAVVGRAEKIPFPARSFDVVTLMDVLEHTDDEIVIAEVTRVLKPSGLLIASVPAYPWLWSSWDTVLGHRRRYTAQTLLSVLRKSGFKPRFVTHAYIFALLPVILIRILKSLLYADQQYPSDFAITNGLIQKTLLALTKVERYVALRWHIPIPWGLSIFVAAQT